MVRLTITTLSAYGKKITRSIKADQPELNRRCSCPPGESCRVQLNELPNSCFEVFVIRPRRLTQPTDWLPLPAVNGMYRMTFEKRATADSIYAAIADIVAAPIEDKDSDIQASTSPPEVHVMFVSAETLGRVRKLIRGCQACSPSADVPFEEILDRVSGHRAAVTRYIFLGSVTCPRCCGRVAATTLIEVEPTTHRAI
jgi:hypothetical protein